MEIDERLDARGLNCPLPVLKTQKRLKSMAAGRILELLADDPRAPSDLRQFIEVSGHALVLLEEHGDGMRALIRCKL